MGEKIDNVLRFRISTAEVDGALGLVSLNAPAAPSSAPASGRLAIGDAVALPTAEPARSRQFVRDGWLCVRAADGSSRPLCPVEPPKPTRG
jgi:hypothetical protein